MFLHGRKKSGTQRSGAAHNSSCYLGSYRARRRQAKAKPPSESTKIDAGSGTKLALVATLNREVSNSWAVVVAPDGRMANVSNVNPPRAPGVVSVKTTCAVPSLSSVPPVIETFSSRPADALRVMVQTIV